MIYKETTKDNETHTEGVPKAQIKAPENSEA